MQTFNVIIKKNCLSVYEINGKAYEKVYLGGNPEYAFSINSAADYAKRFLEIIIEEYNLDSVGEIDLIVIDNEDKIIANVMINAFGESVKKIISVESLVDKVFSSLGRDKELFIYDYGINYDGKNYLMQNGKMRKEEFSLLAYPLTDDMLMKFFE